MKKRAYLQRLVAAIVLGLIVPTVFGIEYFFGIFIKTVDKIK